MSAICISQECLRLHKETRDLCPGVCSKPRGRSGGRHPAKDPKRHVASQRYTEGEHKLLSEVAGGPGAVNEFIHDAAIDRARAFAEQHGGE